MAIKEIHNAIVTRNIDPAKGVKGEGLRGAVYFTASTLFDGEFPIPAEPCFPFASLNGAGFFVVPKVGDEIEIEIEADDGSDDTTDVELPEPRWRCMVYSDVADIADEFKENYPFTMGWKSNAGHIFIMEDHPDHLALTLRTALGSEFQLSETRDKFGAFLKTVAGHLLTLDDKNQIVELLHVIGTKINITPTAFTIEHVAGHKILMNATDIIIEHIAGGKITITPTDIEIVDATGAQSIKLEVGKVTAKALLETVLESEFVKLGKTPTFHAALAENVIASFDSHQHPPHLPLIGGPILPPIIGMSAFAGTPLDPTALRILMKGNI